MSWVFVSEKRSMHNLCLHTNNVYIYLVRNSMTRFFVVCLCLSVLVSVYMYVHMFTERKKFSKLFTSLIFIYKSMLLKCFRIEQFCPSIDSIISLLTLRHYVIVNLNFHENHMQYVHS